MHRARCGVRVGAQERERRRTLWMMQEEPRRGCLFSLFAGFGSLHAAVGPDECETFQTGMSQSRQPPLSRLVCSSWVEARWRGRPYSVLL